MITMEKQKVQTGLQHGDVLLIRKNKLPKMAEKLPRENNNIIVMKGELTGHNHVINDETADMYVLTSRKGTHVLKTYYLDITSPVTIKHEEHKPLLITTGVYLIGRIKEYDHINRKVRLAAD
jgi:hypothetical protein